MKPHDGATAPLTYTVDQAAALLGLCRTAMFNAVKRGEVPSIRLGRRVLIPRVSFDRMLAEGSPIPVQIAK